MVSKFQCLVAVLALLVGGGVDAWAKQVQQPSGTWASETAGTQLQLGGGTTDANYLWVWGYYQPGAGNPSNDLYRPTRRYDPVGNTWSVMADLPTGVMYHCGASYNGRVYSFGNGYNANGAIYAYDVASNTWSALGVSLSNNRFYAACATLGDRIYITGGGYYSYSTLCDEFNPAGNGGAGTITARAAMPGSGLYYHTMAGVESVNKVYALSGYGPGGYSAATYEYTPIDTDSSTTNDNTWATRTPIQNASGTPQGSQRPGSFSLSGRIYVVGGINSTYQTWNYEYNPITDTWTQRASMAGARYWFVAGAINNKGYVYGGYPSTTTGEEFTPPVFGSPPNAPANVAQAGARPETALQAQADANQYDGWTNRQVSFSANVTDPDANQQVRFRVRVRNMNTQTWTNLDSGLQNQGLITIPWTIPSDGGYAWQYRVEDTFGNSYPPVAGQWAEAFNNATNPDFRSDQVPPADPVALSPNKTDIAIFTPTAADVPLHWTESIDNGPVSGISYELQVARDGGFVDIEAQIISSAGIDTYPVPLTYSPFDKYWRVRARDIGGNFSAWSPSLSFRVVYDDMMNHGSGDAKKSCGFATAGAAAPGAALALLGLALLVLGSTRNRRKLA